MTVVMACGSGIKGAAQAIILLLVVAMGDERSAKEVTPVASDINACRRFCPLDGSTGVLVDEILLVVGDAEGFGCKDQQAAHGSMDISAKHRRANFTVIPLVIFLSNISFELKENLLPPYVKCLLGCFVG